MDIGVTDLEDLKTDLPEGILIFPLLTDVLHTSHPLEVSFSVVGTNVDYYEFYQLAFRSGDWFVSEDVRAGNSVIVLNSQLAKYLFESEAAIGRTISFLSTHDLNEYTVIGVLDHNPDFFDNRSLLAYVPFSSPLFSKRSFSSISIGVGADMDLDLALEQVSHIMNAHFGNPVNVVSNLGEYKDSLLSMAPILRNIGLFASVGLIIAVVNILNLMLTRVLRRIKQAGIHMALGSTRIAIFRQFLSEALALALIGSLYCLIMWRASYIGICWVAVFPQCLCMFMFYWALV